jgi:hypothetical protein
MARPSLVGPGTEAGKQILKDFKGWRNTGYKPWGRGIGSAAHYQCRQMYQVVSKNAFRSQCKKLAQIALEQMPAEDCEPANQDTDKSSDDDDDGAVSLPCNSENKNPWQQELFEDNDEQENDDDDDDFSMGSEGTEDSLADFFEDIKLGELQNSQSPMVSEYPGSNKLMVLFPLDGDVLDENANQFEFFDDDKAIKRWSRVPKEREDAVAMIGKGSEDRSGFGFTDVDLMIVEAEINERLQRCAHKRDHKGENWEEMESITLPFRVVPTLYNKKGRKLSTFRMRSNGRGFSWAYFWLLAPEKPRAKQSKRIGGKKVQVMEDSSVYTEKTVHSDRPLSEINF